MRMTKLLALLVAVVCPALAQAPASAPEWTMRELSGGSRSLAAYRGKVVVVNFWATWCTPCTREMPIFVDVARRYGSRDVVVLAASLDDERTRKYIPQFARSHKMSFPILVDVTPEIMGRFGLEEVVPSTVFLDRDGRIAARIAGQAGRKEVLERVEWLLGARDGATPAPWIDHAKKR